MVVIAIALVITLLHLLQWVDLTEIAYSMIFLGEIPIIGITLNFILSSLLGIYAIVMISRTISDMHFKIQCQAYETYIESVKSKEISLESVTDEVEDLTNSGSDLEEVLEPTTV